MFSAYRGEMYLRMLLQNINITSWVMSTLKSTSTWKVATWKEFVHEKLLLSKPSHLKLSSLFQFGTSLWREVKRKNHLLSESLIDYCIATKYRCNAALTLNEKILQRRKQNESIDTLIFKTLFRNCVAAIPHENTEHLD